MPDLEEQIAQWRQRMAADGVKSFAVLDELESHLREDIQLRILAGDSESIAFQSAVAQIGSAGSLRMEFNKNSGAASLPVLIGASIWIGAVVLGLVLFSHRVAAGTLGPLLFMHVLTITSGYGAAFLVGALAACYIYFRWAGRLSPALREDLTRATLRFTYISAVLNVTGFLLGMVWARKYRGAVWLNDPREFGGVCVCLWFVVLCLAYSTKKVTDHTRMLLSLIGNMIVAPAWFGAGILAHNPAMHWYGVANYLPLQLFMGVHLLFLLMAFSRKLETAET
jgi:Cytochrome C assembly protein